MEKILPLLVLSDFLCAGVFYVRNPLPLEHMDPSYRALAEAPPKLFGAANRTVGVGFILSFSYAIVRLLLE